MVVSTHIYRVSDGLPMTASVDNDVPQNDELMKVKKQMKQIVSRLSSHSESRASIASGNYQINYLISSDFVYVVVCERSYPKKLAFPYLEELDQEFNKSYGDRARKPGLRPYAFVEFDNFIQQTKRVYQDSRATQNLDRLNAELQDVTKVMTKNIEDLLYRGDSLDKMSDLSSSLKMESKKYRKAAQRINFEALLRQYAPVAGLSVMVLVLLYFMFFR